MRSFRCSSLPLLLACPASAVPPDVLVREHCDQAGVGTEAHALLDGLARTGSPDWESASSVEVRSLLAGGVDVWREMAPLMPSPITEMALQSMLPSGVLLTGHADVVSVYTSSADGGRGVVLDWKSGRVDHDYSPQLLGYAALLLLDDLGLERVDAYVAWLRDREVQRFSLTRAQLPAWIDSVESALRHPERFVTGGQCEHCPRSHECTGRAAMVRRDVGAFGLTAEELSAGLATVPPERVIEIVRQARMVGRLADRAVDAVRNFVTEHGDIVAPDGTRLTLTSERRRQVDTAAAWEILCDALDAGELAGCVDVKLSKAEDAVARKAGRGHGAQAKRTLAAALEAAGAIGFTEVHRLTERRS